MIIKVLELGLQLWSCNHQSVITAYLLFTDVISAKEHKLSSAHQLLHCFFILLSRVCVSEWVCVWACSVISDSLWSHRLYPIRLLYLWNFPVKNTVVGCHLLQRSWYQYNSETCCFFFLLEPYVIILFMCSVVSNSLQSHGLVACQALLSMEFPSQEYWSGRPFPALGDLPDPRIKPTSPALEGGFFITEPPGKPSPYVRQQLNL